MLISEFLMIQPIKFQATYVGKRKADNWEHYLWFVEMEIVETQSGKKNRRYETDYRCGMGHSVSGYYMGKTVKKPSPPRIEDVLFSLSLDCRVESHSFSEWCEEFGYSDDSIKALKVYQQCMEEYDSLKKFFGPVFRNFLQLEED